MNHDHSQHDFEPAVREEDDGRLVVVFMDPVAVMHMTSNTGS